YALCSCTTTTPRWNARIAVGQFPREALARDFQPLLAPRQDHVRDMIGDRRHDSLACERWNVLQGFFNHLDAALPGTPFRLVVRAHVAFDVGEHGHHVFLADLHHPADPT